MFIRIAAAALVSLVALQTLAQQTGGQAQSTNPPEPTHFYVPYGPSISLSQAMQVAAAAVAEASRHNWKEDVAIVDPGGELVYFERMDGCQSASAAISQAKAQSAVRYRRPTKIFQTQLDAGQLSLLSLPGLVAREGGVPLVLDGKLIGAIGASGDTSPNDGVVANAGVAALKMNSK